MSTSLSEIQFKSNWQLCVCYQYTVQACCLLPAYVHLTAYLTKVLLHRSKLKLVFLTHLSKNLWCAHSKSTWQKIAYHRLNNQILLASLCIAGIISLQDEEWFEALLFSHQCTFGTFTWASRN